MNRIFKKAISFVTALGVSTMLCANAAIAASASTLSMQEFILTNTPLR